MPAGLGRWLWAAMDMTGMDGVRQFTQPSGVTRNAVCPHGRTRRAILGTAATLAVLAVVLPALGAERRVAHISLVDGVASGEGLVGASGRASTLVFTAGDSIELRWKSDRDMVLHLHGYDLEARVGPGREETIAFVARAAGRFPLETHDLNGRHRAVLYIEIHPR